MREIQDKLITEVKVGRGVPAEPHPKLPNRKKLPHDTPSWVKSGEKYFITICGSPRGKNQFCIDQTSTNIIKSVQFNNTNLTWHCSLALLMPDHIHAIISFPNSSEMKKTISAWKGYTKRMHNISWQSDFFDHRLRTPESLDEKISYIKMNPVRAKLIENPEEWPYIYEAAESGSAGTPRPTSQLNITPLDL